MSNAQLETAIEAAWEARDSITPATTGEQREAIEATLQALDSGSLRVAEKTGQRRLACEPVGQKGGSARLPHQGYGNAVWWSAGLQLVGQGRQQIHGLGRC